MEKIIVGNTTVTGFVNNVDAATNSFLLGTGSFNNRDGVKVFKESIKVFVDKEGKGEMPEKGKFVAVRGDLTVEVYADKMRPKMSVRFEDQITYPQQPAAAGAGKKDDI